VVVLVKRGKEGRKGGRQQTTAGKQEEEKNKAAKHTRRKEGQHGVSLAIAHAQWAWDRFE
jgi:hypothetical protein